MTGAFGAGVGVGMAASGSRAYRHGFEDALELVELDGYPVNAPPYR